MTKITKSTSRASTALTIAVAMCAPQGKSRVRPTAQFPERKRRAITFKVSLRQSHHIVHRSPQRSTHIAQAQLERIVFSVDGPIHRVSAPCAPPVRSCRETNASKCDNVYKKCARNSYVRWERAATTSSRNHVCCMYASSGSRVSVSVSEQIGDHSSYDVKLKMHTSIHAQAYEGRQARRCIRTFLSASAPAYQCNAYASTLLALLSAVSPKACQTASFGSRRVTRTTSGA